MENASKALLISAAVLIVLLLIGVGIRTIDSTSGLRDQVDTSTQSAAISSFNSQFTQYCSNSASASEARALIQKILAHNSTISNSSTFSASSHHVYLNYYPTPGSHGGHNWKTAELQNIYNQISDYSKYEIFISNDCEDYAGGFYNGYIICISIAKI